MVEKVEFFLFKRKLINFFLYSVFTYYFEQDAPIAMKYGINLFHYSIGCFPEVGMVIIFAPYRTEFFIASSGELCAADFTFGHNVYVLIPDVSR